MDRGEMAGFEHEHGLNQKKLIGFFFKCPKRPHFCYRSGNPSHYEHNDVMKAH